LEVTAQEFVLVLGKYTFVLFNPRFERGTDVPSVKCGIDRLKPAVSHGIIQVVLEGQLYVLIMLDHGWAQVLVTLDHQKVLLVLEIVKRLLLINGAGC
jgi:hypothetical protein